MVHNAYIHDPFASSSSAASASALSASQQPSSKRQSPVTTGLTTFPNPFADEPEQGILPALLSKVKLTFASVTPASSVPAPQASSSTSTTSAHGDKGGHNGGSGGLESRSSNGGSQSSGPTEAQQLVEAVKNQRSHAHAQPPVRKTSGSHGSSVPIAQSTSSSSTVDNLPSGHVSRSSATATPHAGPSSPRRGQSQSQSQLAPPMSATSSTSSGHTSQPAPSLSQSLQFPARRLIPPGERQWRPSGAAPAQVTISPVTSVTTTVQSNTPAEASSSSSAANRFPHRAHFGLQAVVASSSRSTASPLLHHAHQNSFGGRGRRSSIATIPDSPSSVSLSAMIAANVELSQNFSYVPGFPLGNDDTRSVRSLGFSKKPNNSVSRIIRRIRGEGLSKHYWMADEHCKECYDCKSAFSAWRRKHHCRICGQIFCSRCASNIIGAKRFGQEGAVRVCNLCLKIMEEYKDDDEDDRRSINSLSASVRLPSFGERALLEKAISPETPYAQSPFAASQLFIAHPEEQLASIQEGKVSSPWGAGIMEEMQSDRPFTPVSEGEEDDHIWTMRPNTAAPFRRPMDEDANGKPSNAEHETSPEPDTSNQASPQQSSGQSTRGNTSRVDLIKSPKRPTRMVLPRSDTMLTDFTDVRAPLSRMNSNAPLIGLRTRLSSRASQGGLTALLDTEKAEGLWRARSRSFAMQKPDIFATSSLGHFHIILQQAIARADLPHPEEWHRVLGKLLLKVSSSLNPNVRGGDSIDVRAFVKIKKVPGGKISDSEYVDGIVLTKNVAHKGMPRRLVNPRIMLLTFPLDYHRIENQFMSLEPIMAQEKDYLRLLTRRIIDVRPHIVLVERTASRIALDYLLEANIAVARSVKLSAIHQVARCTQADVLASMDRLALEPRLGRCAEFQIQSFEHQLIPGRRKTLMRFEGCPKDFGCTIILRGGDTETLRKVKVVTDFMALVVYHLKNEIILYSDEHNIYPPRPLLPTHYQELLDVLAKPITDLSASVMSSHTERPSSPAGSVVGSDEGEDDERTIERREAAILTREIARSLEPYLTTVLSSSAAISFAPPAPLARMAELDRQLAALRLLRDEEEAAQILHDETKPSDAPKIITSDQEAVSVPALMLNDGIQLAAVDIPSSSAMSVAQTGATKDVRGDPYRVLRKPEEIAKESLLNSVKHDHEEQTKLWQWYTRRHAEVLRPEDFQGIVYLFSLGCEGQEKPCIEPRLDHVDFYQPDDSTVGQFLENLAAHAASKCLGKACERLMLYHFRLLVHGDRRLQIAMDPFPCPSPGHEDQIITWSYCRHCATPSPTTIMREETWRMSWGAYLEHCFYPPETSAGFTCPHDAFRDQIRYFAHRNLAIRIHNEKVDIYEPLRPSIQLQIKAETKVVLKNQEYELILGKNTAFFDSVLFRLRSFDYELVQPEKVTVLRTALEAMLSRAVADREELVNLLNRTYKLTPMIDVLALNTVLRTLQDKVVQWDADFVDVERTFMPSEKDLRRTNHLKRLFANQEVFNALDRQVPSVSEADEKETKLPEPGDETSGPSTPAVESPPEGDVSEQPSGLGLGLGLVIDNLQDDAKTPMNVVHVKGDPMGSAPTSPRSDDSDSTIGARKKDKSEFDPGPRGDAFESSGMESSIPKPFVSRLPRRTRPAASIADIVKRFQDSSSPQRPDIGDGGDLPSPLPASGGLRRTHSHRHRVQEISDSDGPNPVRPRLRRGKTEQAPTRARDVSRHPVSDNDRSYAANASRIPSTTMKRTNTAFERPSIHRKISNPSPLISGSGRTTPDISNLAAGLPMSRRPTNSSSEGKPRITGKGKATRPAEVAGRSVPTFGKPGRRTLGPPASRVTSIARHFDRLSREAERERQKRISMVRGKRARPVGVTKAKVEVFSNLRDAFKDEFDTDSSEADNEEDDQDGEDSADSAGQIKPKVRSSPKKRRSTSPIGSPITKPVDVQPSLSTDSITSSIDASPAESVPISASSSIAGQSILSDARSEMSFTDRLQIELPSFETSAPLPSVPATPHLSNTDTADEGKVQVSGISQMSESEMSSGGGERSSILKTLTGLWAFRAGDFTPLEYPLSASEHIFADSRVIIRENEPTSIIAFTLSSKTYRDKVRHYNLNAKSGKVEAFMPDDGATERSSMWDIVSLDEAVETDDGSSRKEGGTHLKYDFESGSSTIFCRIFFAEQFAALRSACDCEDSFVESLARCVQFDAAGGKSGSAFLKTKDDRFIAKEISRLEMDALTKFAPAYFEYTRKAFQGQRPTVLAKIYGFFKIGYRNAITGRAMRMNVLIMENLFYERRFSKIYDLKGSTRNRLIQPTGRVNEVLLDENLMELVYKHPLYLREHSKRILRSALFNDTLFLSNLNVMDYSLVVGVDSEKHELVVGIVDYIRTFTWDKKLESWVKDSAFLGGAGKGEPTIVTPKQYKTRFRTAMEKFYFPSVPDRWSKPGTEETQYEEDAGATNMLA